MLSACEAAESDSRETVSLKELRGDLSDGSGSPEVLSSESKDATMFKLSISFRIRAMSDCFCCKTSYAFFISDLRKLALARP